MVKQKKIVFHSIDSPRRELEWRIFIAVKLAEKGFTNVIGSKTEIEYLHEFSRNCFFLGRLNSVTGRYKSDLEYLKRMEQNGTKLFYLHDEGGFYFRGEYDDAVKKIYPDELFNSKSFDKIFFWGERQRSVFEDHAEKSKFVVTGSPRFDLLKPCFHHIDIESVEKLRKRYGSFVLVCTRFGAVNRVPDEPTTLSKRSYDIRAEGGALKKYSQAQVLETMFGAWEKISYEFSSFVPSLAKLVQDFPDVKFVIRPHPAERQSFYTESFSHFGNVIVEKSGDVRPYIRAAEVVIHSECTTGVEAEIAGKPTINFRPCMNIPKYEGFSVEGVCDIGVLCDSYESLRCSLETALSGESHRNYSRTSATQYLANSDEENLSFDKIVNALQESFESNSEESYLPLFKVRSLLQLMRLLKNKLRSVRDRFLTVRIQKKGDSKFFKFDDEAIVKFVAELNGFEVKVRRKGPNLIISPSKKKKDIVSL